MVYTFLFKYLDKNLKILNFSTVKLSTSLTSLTFLKLTEDGAGISLIVFPTWHKEISFIVIVDIFLKKLLEIPNSWYTSVDYWIAFSDVLF